MESLARSKRLSLSAMWGEGKREVPQRRNHLSDFARQRTWGRAFPREGTAQAKIRRQNSLGIWGNDKQPGWLGLRICWRSRRRQTWRGGLPDRVQMTLHIIPGSLGSRP